MKGTDAMERLLKRPSPATVLATLALIFATAGVAPAAKKLVTGKDIAKNTITSTNVKDRSLKSVDFAPGTLVPGPQGAAGAKGATGAQGAQGESGMPGNDGADGPQGPAGNDGAPGDNGENGADGQGPAYFKAFTGLTVGSSSATVATLGATTGLALAPYIVSAQGTVSASGGDAEVACYFKYGPSQFSDTFTTYVPGGGHATLAFSWGRMVPAGTVELVCSRDSSATIDELVMTAIQATTITTGA